MGHPYCQCPVLIFGHPWRGSWASEYRDFSSQRISSLIFASGNPSGEHNLYGHWCSPVGRCFSWFPCAADFDSHGSQAAKDASASHDKLIELFNHIECFFRRLEIYTGTTPTTAMRDIIIEIMVEVLTILAITTKEVKRGRLSELMSRRFTTGILD
jgi:hypothetical protein